MQPSSAWLCLRALAVQTSGGDALLVQLLESLVCLLMQLLQFTELDGLGRAGLCTRGLETVDLAVIAHRALPASPVAVQLVGDAERAGSIAVAAPVADV